MLVASQPMIRTPHTITMQSNGKNKKTGGDFPLTRSHTLLQRLPALSHAVNLMCLHTKYTRLHLQKA